ncbi:hypothetical protein MPSEU_000855300 [Mayamaea pseudoterrestris]|nr:hypothetical protein MPSEU_000855300 [Mayamaea pseudoterrestris]
MSLTIIVTAHPDDESMFFLPTMRALQMQQPHVPLWLLCLTTGNFHGLGETRRRELGAVAETLRLNKLLIVDDSNISDHMVRRWNVDYTAKIISKTINDAILQENICCKQVRMITFDSMGVSGHVNHVDTYLATKQFCQMHANTFTLWTLTTVRNPAAKYLPIQEWMRLFHYWCLSLLFFVGWTKAQPQSSLTITTKQANVVQYHLLQPRLNWKCMALHASQFVWYRRLFVAFSCYTYVNRLERDANMEKEKQN